VENLAKQGVKSVAVLNPGFVVDCLETVDEIGNEAAHLFHENGGENFSHIPCLNDSEEGMKVIETMVRRELLGWV
jgi:ferrochelatase